MSPAELCRLAYAAGLELYRDGDLLRVAPADRLHPDMRALLVAHKPELLRFLAEAEQTAEELAAAALAACARWGDSQAAREQMRADCTTVPPHQRADLLAHFRSNYPPREDQGHDRSNP